MPAFGTRVSPAHFVEVADPLNPGQVKRPGAGVVLKVTDTAGNTLPDIVTEELGYWSYTATADLIFVSGDNGVTWVGPLVSDTGTVTGVNSGATAASALTVANAADTKAQQALDKPTGAITGAPTTWPTTFPPIIGTTAATAAAGNHNHDAAYYTKAQVDAKVASSGGGGGGTLDTMPTVTRYETTPGVYPVRGTARSDLRITWVGTVQPPIATAGSGTNFLTTGTAMDGIDAYEKI